MTLSSEIQAGKIHRLSKPILISNEQCAKLSGSSFSFLAGTDHVFILSKFLCILSVFGNENKILYLGRNSLSSHFQVVA